MVTETLAGVYVGDMNFHGGGGHGGQGVGQGNGGVRVGTRVDDDTVDRIAQFMNFIEQFAFVI